MNQLKINELCFTYPNAPSPALQDLTLEVRRGEFVVFCGISGSGKSTLLRYLKPAIAPKGETKGEILFCGTQIDLLDARDQAAKIGFVAQQPDSQIATDKVWHELAFGLESLGVDRETIRRRGAETAAYFGMQTWFDRETDRLSGGQKQLLNLAAVMVMRPEMIVLDEPVSRLDPIAAREFIETMGRLNRETGLTVIIAEHNLEELLAIADRMIVMDGGEIRFDGSPEEAGRILRKAVIQWHWQCLRPCAFMQPAKMSSVVHSRCGKDGVG